MQAGIQPEPQPRQQPDTPHQQQDCSHDGEGKPEAKARSDLAESASLGLEQLGDVNDELGDRLQGRASAK